jgi:hypothetical protein
VRDRLKKITTEICTDAKIGKPDSLQYYNVWSFGQCDTRYGLKGFPGRIPGQIIENLLYYYTEPFDIPAVHLGLPRTTIQGWLDDNSKSKVDDNLRDWHHIHG